MRHAVSPLAALARGSPPFATRDSAARRARPVRAASGSRDPVPSPSEIASRAVMPLDDRTGGFHHAERDTVFFRPCSPEDLPAVAEMEANSYPPDEKASPEALAFRQQNANEFFLVGMRMSDTERHREAATETGDASASAADALVSYVCGTLTTGTTLTHESMSEHDPSGTTLCVHSVVTCGSSRREGIGTKTLRAYCRWVATRYEEIDVILLLCKKHLIGFYEGAGFKMVGESSVVHGADQWYDMRLKTVFVRAVMESAAEDGE